MIGANIDIQDLDPLGKGSISPLSIFIALLLFFLGYQYFNSLGNVDIGHFPKHKSIGTKITFDRPMCYTIRKVDAIVPFVAKIKNELGVAHPQRSDEEINISLPKDAVYTIVDAYSYSDVMNHFRLYFVLRYAKKDYIISERSLNEYRSATSTTPQPLP